MPAKTRAIKIAAFETMYLGRFCLGDNAASANGGRQGLDSAKFGSIVLEPIEQQGSSTRRERLASGAGLYAHLLAELSIGYWACLWKTALESGPLAVHWLQWFREWCTHPILIAI